VFSPTTHDRLKRFQAHIGHRAVEHTVDITEERFDLYIPARESGCRQPSESAVSGSSCSARSTARS
jgi:hypothetical protein